MHKYANAFEEAYVILQYLDKEDFEKIPKELLKVIDENRNKDYEYEMNDEIDIENQEMLVETKALLFNIFRDYLSTPEQKEKIIMRILMKELIEYIQINQCHGKKKKKIKKKK